MFIAVSVRKLHAQELYLRLLLLELLNEGG